MNRTPHGGSYAAISRHGRVRYLGKVLKVQVPFALQVRRALFPAPVRRVGSCVFASGAAGVNKCDLTLQRALDAMSTPGAGAPGGGGFGASFGGAAVDAPATLIVHYALAMLAASAANELKTALFARSSQVSHLVDEAVSSLRASGVSSLMVTTLALAGLSFD